MKTEDVHIDGVSLWIIVPLDTIVLFIKQRNTHSWAHAHSTLFLTSKFVYALERIGYLLPQFTVLSLWQCLDDFIKNVNRLSAPSHKNTHNTVFLSHFTHEYLLFVLLFWSLNFLQIEFIMGFLTTEKCCGFLSLRTGGLILGWIPFILCFREIIQSLKFNRPELAGAFGLYKLVLWSNSKFRSGFPQFQMISFFYTAVLALLLGFWIEGIVNVSKWNEMKMIVRKHFSNSDSTVSVFVFFFSN